jgi:hypothetical protein
MLDQCMSGYVRLVEVKSGLFRLWEVRTVYTRLIQVSSG